MAPILFHALFIYTRRDRPDRSQTWIYEVRRKRRPRGRLFGRHYRNVVRKRDGLYLHDVRRSTRYIDSDSAMRSQRVARARYSPETEKFTC